MSSGSQVSWSNSSRIFLQAFEVWTNWKLNGDFDGDGFVSWWEAKLYEMLNYKDSVTPFFFQIGDERFRIAENQQNNDQVKNTS